MEGAHVSTLQHGPEALHPVGVGLSPDILSNAVLDGFMIRQNVIDQGVVGVDLGIGSRVLHDESDHGFRFGIGDDLSRDFLSHPVLDPCNSRLAHWPTPFQLGSLGFAHVPTLAAHVGFVHFHRTGEQRTILR